MKHNGIELGPESPLIEKARRRLAAQYEESDQVNLMALLVGPAVKGQPRSMTGGMIPKHPELFLLTHIPNAGAGASRGMAGRMKAMGVLAGYPDLHLPVMRGPFLTLYLELKRRGQRPRPDQARLHEMLRMEGHCVMSAVGVQAGMEIILGYLALPKNRVSARPVPRDLVSTVSSITARIDRWRTQCYAMLTPTRETP